MKRILSMSTVFMLTIGLFAGCAGSKKAAAPHPLAGMWDYSVDTPEGTYTGVVTITEAEDGLIGSITNDALAGSMDISDLAFADDKLTFVFDSGQFGMISFSVDVAKDMFDGTINVPDFGDMPVSGKRKMMDEGN